MLNIFKSRAREKSETKALLAALYFMTMTDDKVSEQERAYFRNVCKEKGLSQQEISDIIGNNSVLSQNVPIDRQKQEGFFADLVSMGIVDGIIDPSELEFLEKYAKMMGLADTKEKTGALIEDIVKRKKAL